MGPTGADVDTDSVMAFISEEVVKAVAGMPPAPKGDKGDRGDAGEKGQPGVGIAAAMINREGELFITATDGIIYTLGSVVGKDGAPGQDGKDGRDGFSLKDFDMSFDGDRTLTFSFKDSGSDLIVKHCVELPYLLDRGVWNEEVQYVKGDVVSWGGSMFVSQEDNLAIRPETDKTWRLAVKRGRQGASGKDGKDGLPGRPGRDLTGG
jgi:integrin beta 3